MEKEVSFVFTGRNDNYGGDFQTRLQHCVNVLYKKLNDFQIRSEIIFVNYNPLAEPQIIDFINWPKSTSLIDVKIYTVSAEIHLEFVEKYSVRNIPVLEYLGKNAGIRRAKGTFIACINPDVLMPDEIFRTIKKGLSPSFYYKADRLDVQLDSNWKIREYVRLKLRGHSFQISKYNFLLASWWKSKYAILNFYKYHTPCFKKLLDLIQQTVYYNNVEYKYHCMAGGDFMMMHNKSWLKLQGYHENAPIALHIDGLMTIQAVTSGLEEFVFRHPLIHQEHGRRFNSDQVNVHEKAAYVFFQQESKNMLKGKKTCIYSSGDWGLINFELPESIIK